MAKIFKLIRYMEEDGEEIKPEYYHTREKLDERIDKLSNKRIKQGGYGYSEGEDYEIEEEEVK